VVGVALLATYAAYVVATLRGGAPAEEMPEPLHMLRHRPGEPPVALVTVQLIVSVGLLVIGSDLFVSALNDTAAALHTDPLILALIVVPVATELPETFNSVLWVRSGHDSLAFGNVAGSAAFQACVLGFIGLTFTPWRPGFSGILSGLLTLGVGAYLWLLLRSGSARGRWLMLAGVPWIAYVLIEVLAGGRLGG
jgi:cation:H+ antiporter